MVRTVAQWAGVLAIKYGRTAQKMNFTMKLLYAVSIYLEMFRKYVPRCFMKWFICIAMNITSKGHTYHNKRFKEVAENHGLIVEYDKRIGWSIAKLTDEAKTFVEANTNKEVFTLTRNRHGAVEKPSDEGGEEEDPKPKQSMRKYVCPACGTIIRATKDVNVKCADCDEIFVKEEI